MMEVRFASRLVAAVSRPARARILALVAHGPVDERILSLCGGEDIDRVRDDLVALRDAGLVSEEGSAGRWALREGARPLALNYLRNLGLA